jgi:hypothetical protein
MNRPADQDGGVFLAPGTTRSAKRAIPRLGVFLEGTVEHLLDWMEEYCDLATEYNWRSTRNSRGIRKFREVERAFEKDAHAIWDCRAELRKLVAATGRAAGALEAESRLKPNESPDVCGWLRLRELQGPAGRSPTPAERL